jgi:uncharacterized protein
MTETRILNLASTAPHVWPASQWRDAFPKSEKLLLHRSSGPPIEVGILRWEKGTIIHQTALDMLCYIMQGTGRFVGRKGEIIQAAPGAAIHFKQGWSGEIEAHEEIHASYMMCEGGPMETTPVLPDVMTAAPLKDWGEIPKMIWGASRTAGILLSREKNGRAESGIWTCTPGTWHCEVTSDEYCHFLAGSCTYIHDNGEKIEIRPDTLSFFSKGWIGRCEVGRTIRKVYMIR